MDARSEIRDFPTARGARATPEGGGLHVYGARRVPGLRREEVAMLAGLSVDYYSRLERGSLGGASDGVLDRTGRRAAPRRGRTRASARSRPRQSPDVTRPAPRDHADRPSQVQWMLDSM